MWHAERTKRFSRSISSAQHRYLSSALTSPSRSSPQAGLFSPLTPLSRKCSGSTLRVPPLPLRMLVAPFHGWSSKGTIAMHSTVLKMSNDQRGR